MDALDGNDLLDFVAANAGLTSSPLAPAMADMIKTSDRLNISS